MAYRRDETNDEPEPVALDSGALRDTLGGNYKHYLNALIDLGIVSEYTEPYTYTIKGKEHHCRGSFSTRFGKSKRYVVNTAPSTPLITYTIKDPSLTRKINKARREKLARLIENNPTARHNYESLKRITIDTAKAIAYTQQKYGYRELFRLARQFLSVHTALELKTFIKDIRQANTKDKRQAVMTKYKPTPIPAEDAHKYVKLYDKNLTRFRSVRLLDAIQKGNHDLIWLSDDRHSGRIFHPLSSLPADLRPFIRIDNRPLVEYDAANCQWKLFEKLCNIYKAPSSGGVPSLWLGLDLSKYLALKKPENSNQKKADNNMLHKKYRVELDRLDAYLDKGLLKEAVILATRNQGRTCDDAKAKKWLIGNVLFGNPNEKGYLQFPSVKIFRELFPLLYDLKCKFKRYHINETALGYKPFDRFDRPNKWKALPRLLQRMETEIFIKGMEDVQTPFITLHDAVITTEAGEIQVLKALEKRIKESGTNIKLNRKTYATN